MQNRSNTREKTSKSTSQSERGNQKTQVQTEVVVESEKTIIFFQPFPYLLSEEQYEHFIDERNKRKGEVIEFNGFEILHTDKEIDDSYLKYKADFEHLIDIIREQKKDIIHSFAKDNEKVKIEVVFLPLDEKELKQLRELMENLKKSDILLVNAHGNTQVIGIAEFSMNDKSIAKNLIHIGLPNPPPTIALWACDTGTEVTKKIGKHKKTRSLASDVHEHLMKADYETPTIMAPSGKLTTRFTATNKPRKDGITVGEKIPDKRGNLKYKSHSPSKFFNVSTTPRSKQALNFTDPESPTQSPTAKPRRRSLISQVRFVSDMRAKHMDKRAKVESPKVNDQPKKPKTPPKPKDAVKKIRRRGVAVAPSVHPMRLRFKR